MISNGVISFVSLTNKLIKKNARIQDPQNTKNKIEKSFSQLSSLFIWVGTK